MKEILDSTQTSGAILVTIRYKDGKPTEDFRVRNTVLNKGREALAGMLVNDTHRRNIFVQNMLFGDGGVDVELNKKKTVPMDQHALFGITRVRKSVLAQLDPSAPNQAIFTAVLRFEDANDVTLNKMALQLNNEDLFSMATFPNLGKTEQMEITFNWRLSFV